MKFSYPVRVTHATMAGRTRHAAALLSATGFVSVVSITNFHNRREISPKQLLVVSIFSPGEEGWGKANQRPRSEWSWVASGWTAVDRKPLASVPLHCRSDIPRLVSVQPKQVHNSLSRIEQNNPTADYNSHPVVGQGWQACFAGARQTLRALL